MENICAKFGSTCLGLFFEFILLFGGVLMALAYEDLGKPRLEYQVGKTSPKETQNGIVSFVRVIVTNKPRRSLFLRRKSAYRCTGTITFLSQDGARIHDEPLPVRWALNPRPTKPGLDQDGQPTELFDHSLMLQSRFMDIPPDDSRNIDVAIRFKEGIAYGWTDESFGTRWRHPQYELPIGSYRVRIALKSEDVKFPPQEFLLENPESIDGFSLELI
jgi:hypothetical protein